MNNQHNHHKDHRTNSAPLTAPHQVMKKKAKGPSPLETRFAATWDSLGGPLLEREYRFHPTRRWRADFAHPQSHTLIEIEGGVWKRGRHVSPQGFIKDAEKYLEAELGGWNVLRLTTKQLTATTIARIIAYVRDRHQPTA